MFSQLSDWSDPLVAVGTIVLAAVTALLAWYTKRLADVTMRPSVVATLEPSRWSVIHFDLHLENEGTAVAFDIRTVFDPPIELDGVKKGGEPPFQEVSILRSGQRMTSFVAAYAALEGRRFSVNVSWARKPGSPKREGVSYAYDMKSFAGVSTLGTDPAVQVAQELKNLSELFQRVTAGRRLSVDIYSGEDRQRADQQMRERLEAQRAAQKAASADRPARTERDER